VYGLGRRGCRDTGRPEDLWGEGIGFQAVGLAADAPGLPEPVGGLAALGAGVPAQGDLLGGEALRTEDYGTDPTIDCNTFKAAVRQVEQDALADYRQLQKVIWRDEKR
jgi:hypothetical protein